MHPVIANTIQSAFAKVGATLVKTYQYDLLVAQRDKLLELYMQQFDTDKRSGTVGILFSMDRPIQLYATLESYFKYVKNPAPLHVMYAMTDEKYNAAYNDVIKEFSNKNVTFIHETKFRDDLITLISSLKEDNLFFLVDDDTFVKEYDMNELNKFNPMKEIVSLRMAPYYTRSYTMNVEQKPPKNLKESNEHKGMLEWNWNDETSGNEWAYPMAVETHLFDRREILAMTKASSFKAPNTYEGVLAQFFTAVKNRKGLCYNQQYIFNNPCNKVQNENDNIAGDITPEFLLEKWNAGLKIDISKFHHLKTSAPHEEYSFTFIKR